VERYVSFARERFYKGETFIDLEDVARRAVCDTWRWNHIRRFLWQPGAFFSGGRRLILTSMEKGDWAGRSIAVLM
jgi:hypothetical protein